MHDDLLVFPNAQQDNVLIAQLSQRAVHGPELDGTCWTMLDNVLKEWSELCQMQYVHVPDLVLPSAAQIRWTVVGIQKGFAGTSP